MANLKKMMAIKKAEEEEKDEIPLPRSPAVAGKAAA